MSMSSYDTTGRVYAYRGQIDNGGSGLDTVEVLTTSGWQEYPIRLGRWTYPSASAVLQQS